MSSRNKAIIGLVLVVAWIGFWRWADTTLPEENKVEVAQTKSPELVCLDLKNEKLALENSAKQEASEAHALQKTLLKERLEQIIDEKVLSPKESAVLKEYLSYDVMKIVSEEPKALANALLRQIDLKPEVVKIFKKLLLLGKLQPFLFKEVQEMGQDLRAKYQEANSIALTNPDCFPSNPEIDELIEKYTKDLSKSDSYNGWIAKQSAIELVDSLL